ncbi:tyrosine-type recombinase/integrase [Bremerella sp.]|uniref:tyrosine-type recombinase/integrase n=1 Tax=Bremerella sp. TaxID=2795602 RepID=UPI00391DE652
MATKVAAVGLIAPREEKEASTLAKFIDGFIANQTKLKPNTSRNYKVTRKHLVSYFGEDKRLSEISPGDARDWHSTLTKKLAPATVSRETKRARQFFGYAVEKRLIRENPFAKLATPAQVNKSRQEFISSETIEKVIAACPDNTWKLIVALARYAGLRIPSESTALKLEDVDWENNRITIRSPKTEHIKDRAFRIIPIFSELRPYLKAVFDEAESGQVYLITRYRDSRSNLRSQFLRIIERAGVKPWGKPFHNLRSSRQTELVASGLSEHSVCHWLGNSIEIAEKHYMQLLDTDFEKALKFTAIKDDAPLTEKVVQKGVRQPAAEDGNPSQETKKARNDRAVLPPISSTCDEMLGSEAPPRGVEPLFSG